MQKFSVSTSKGIITTTDFKSALRVLQLEMENKQRAIKESQPARGRKESDWDKEFQKLLDNYTPKSKEEIIRKKFGGEK